MACICYIFLHVIPVAHREKLQSKKESKQAQLGGRGWRVVAVRLFGRACPPWGCLEATCLERPRHVEAQQGYMKADMSEQVYGHMSTKDCDKRCQKQLMPVLPELSLNSFAQQLPGGQLLQLLSLPHMSLPLNI